MVDIALPDTFSRTVRNTFGADGRRWLTGLPRIADQVLRQWELSAEEPFALSFNWVARVRRADGSTAVLKLGVPEAGHLVDEATTLEFFAGHGAVALLGRDDVRGALLLEEARPGRQLRELVPAEDEAATAVLVDVMRRLHRPAPDGVALPELSRRVASFDDHLRRFPGAGPIPRELVERARGLFAELCATAGERVVLHGDLHHDNVLAAEREPWLAIDPHGVVGDPGYELGALLYNPDPRADDDTVLGLVPARVEQLADGLGMPVERVVAWGFVQAVLSEVWLFEADDATSMRSLRVAELLRPRLP